MIVLAYSPRTILIFFVCVVILNFAVTLNKQKLNKKYLSGTYYVKVT